MGQAVRRRLPSRFLKLPRLYPIMDAEMLHARGLDIAGFAEELLDAGVTMLQYRDKRGDQEQILRNAKLIQEVFRGVQCTLIMNDDPVLAMLSDWNAVHLGQADAAVREARSILPPEGIVGCSTHNDRQVVAANKARADYIAIGPVFATTTKTDAEPVIGLAGVRIARALTARPLVAIGGITPENAASVIDAGADSVSVIGALLRSDTSPREVVTMFLEHMPVASMPNE